MKDVSEIGFLVFDVVALANAITARCADTPLGMEPTTSAVPEAPPESDENKWKTGN